MPLFAWLALGVFLAATASGLAVAVTTGLDAWRTFRTFRRRLARGLGDLLRDVAAVEGRLSHVGETAQRLGRARAELQESLAVASVLAASAGDARAALRVLGFLRR